MTRLCVDDTMTPRRHQSTLFALTVACALLAPACGGSSDGSAAEATPESDAGTTPVDSTPVDSTPVDAAPADTEEPTPVDTAAEPGAGTVSSSGDATWDGEDFVALAETRMDELATVFGQPATAASLSATFVLPDDFPYPVGTVLGTFHVFDRDLRVTDELVINEERIVGVDGANDAATFDAIADSFEVDDATRWERSSSQREQLNNDLFTALPLDGGESRDRLILRGAFEPEPGEPPLTFNFEIAAIEIPTPSWQAGLPILEGGEVTSLREGRGLVEDFGQFAADGHVELRSFYPIERYDELEAFFASGVIAAAGFEHQDTPFSNFAIRIDVSNGDWAGTVAVGDVNVNNQDIGYELIWSLTRPATR